jgi:hypothetical protein
MLIPPSVAATAPQSLRTARVLRVEEHGCEVWDDGAVAFVGFAPIFPSPRTERVSPGHLVAVAAAPDGTNAVVWRWYDAVVVATDDDGSVRLWEPAHGEVVANARTSYQKQIPGSRAWASAGLPGADWWVANSANTANNADVELKEVESMFTEHGLWPAVFEVSP